MLVLSRRAGEKIRIGNDVVITVTQVSKGRVRIGIDAPSEVPVQREEIVDRFSASSEKQLLDRNVRLLAGA